MKIIRVVNKDKWPDGVSDGLQLACGICDMVPSFDYTVFDQFWNTVVPKEYKNGVVCLRCLSFLAAEKGLRITGNLIKVQFTGTNETIVLTPEISYLYKGICLDALASQNTFCKTYSE